MGSLTALENELNERLNKKAPFSIPPEGRKGLAGALWWIALIMGIVQLYAALLLWQAGHAIDRFVNYYTGYVATYHLGPFYYLSLIGMAATAILMLIAAPSLKNMKKRGWDLLFYGVLIKLGAGVVLLFTSVGGGFSSFLGSVLAAVIGAYLLFQVRDQFIGAKAATDPKTAAAATSKTTGGSTPPATAPTSGKKDAGKQ